MHCWFCIIPLLCTIWPPEQLQDAFVGFSLCTDWMGRLKIFNGYDTCEEGGPQDAPSPSSHNAPLLSVLQHVRFAVSFLGMWGAFQKCNVCWFKLLLSSCQTDSPKHPHPSGDAASRGTNVPLINLKLKNVAKRWKCATLKPVSCCRPGGFFTVFIWKDIQTLHGWM